MCVTLQKVIQPACCGGVLARGPPVDPDGNVRRGPKMGYRQFSGMAFPRGCFGCFWVFWANLSAYKFRVFKSLFSIHRRSMCIGFANSNLPRLVFTELHVSEFDLPQVHVYRICEFQFAMPNIYKTPCAGVRFTTGSCSQL